MIIQCEECATRFNVPDGRVSELGTKVRCSKCSVVFYAYASPGATTARSSKTKLAPEAARALAAGAGGVGRVQTARLGTISQAPAPVDGPPGRPKTSPFARVAPAAPGFTSPVGSAAPAYAGAAPSQSPAPIFADPFSAGAAPTAFSPAAAQRPPAAADPFGAPVNANVPTPFAVPSGGSHPVDPFTGQPTNAGPPQGATPQHVPASVPPGADPFARVPDAQSAPPAPAADPFGAPHAGAPPPANADPFSAGASAPFGAPSADPFSSSPPMAANADPFSASPAAQPPPMAPNADPFSQGGAAPQDDPFAVVGGGGPPPAPPDSGFSKVDDAQGVPPINTPSLGNPFQKVSTDPFAEIDSVPEAEPAGDPFDMVPIPDSSHSAPHSTDAVATRIHTVPEEMRAPAVDPASSSRSQSAPVASTGQPLLERLLFRLGPPLGAGLSLSIGLALIVVAVVLAQGGDFEALSQGDWRRGFGFAGAASADGAYALISVSVDKRAHATVPGLVVVAGEIENTSDAPKPLPTITVALKDADGLMPASVGDLPDAFAVDAAPNRTALEALIAVPDSAGQFVEPAGRTAFVAFLFDVEDGAETQINISPSLTPPTP